MSDEAKHSDEIASLDFPTVRRRAAVAAAGGGIACHMEAHALIAELDGLRRQVRDRNEWCDHLAGRESALLLAVPRPFRAFVQRRAERIQREAL
jgi:hypothetical protein